MRNGRLAGERAPSVHECEYRDFVLKKGETLSLRYRVLLHSADWDDARIESAYEDWVRS